jgi:opacity protein-like surface antigen
MRKFFLATGTLLALCATTASYAQWTGWTGPLPAPDAYVGAGVTQARVDDIFGSGHDLDLNNTAWKAYIGIRPIPYFGVEANYMDLGSETRRYFDGTVNHANAHAFSAFGVAFLPLPALVIPVELFGKAGAARWNLSGHTSPSLFALDDHGTDFAWGGGAQTHFGPLGLRLEYEQFNLRDADDVRAVSFDVSFHFL